MGLGRQEIFVSEALDRKGRKMSKARRSVSLDIASLPADNPAEHGADAFADDALVIGGFAAWTITVRTPPDRLRATACWRGRE